MATYYVSPSGSDSRTTTQAQVYGTPWKTMQKAVNAATSGDIIICQDGTYSDRVKFNNTKSGITLQAENEHDAVMDGGWNAYPITVTNRPAEDEQYLGFIDINGSDNITIDGLKIQNWNGRGLNIYGNPSDITVKNVYVSHTYAQAIRFDTATDCVVEDSTFYQASQEKRYYNATPTRLAKDWPVSTHAMRSNNVTFRRNTVANCGGEGIGIDRSSTNCTVEDNVIYDGGPVGIYILYSKNTLVQRNLIYYTDSYTVTNDYKGNRLGISMRDEYQFSGSYNVSSNNKFLNNIIVNPGTAGIQISGNVGMSGTIIANNTIVGGKYGFNIFNKKSEYAWAGCVIENNIVEATSNSISASASEMTWRNNTWLSKPITEARGAGDIYASAKLVNASATVTTPPDLANYQLQESSPAINKARTTPGVETDYHGASRGASPDIGALEYGEAPPVVAAITASTTTPAAGASVTLTDASTISSGAIDEWLWQVSLDGGQTKATIATTQNTSYTPSSTGTYTIYLTVTDNDGPDSDTTTVTLTVGTPVTDPETPTDGETDTDGFSCTGNLLSNPSFDTDVTGWAVSNMSRARITDPTDSTNYVCRMYGTTGGQQMYQSGFALTSGVTYILSFTAWSNRDRDMEIETIQHVSPNADVLDTVVMSTTTTKTRYEYVLDALLTEANTRLRFQPVYLTSSDSLWIDDICLRPYSEVDASFSVSDSSPSLGDTITLTDTSTGSPYAWSWRVTSTAGLDEVISTSAGPVDWAIPGPGEYTIKLTVAGGDNTDYATTSITVSPKPDWFQSGLRRALRKGLP